MGQKMNPFGFRFGVTQNHHSYWFAQSKNHPKLLREDREMRNCIKIYVRKHIRSSSNYGGIVRIEIKRKTNLIQVKIHTGFPALLIESHGRKIEQLKVDVRNLLHFGDRKLRMTLTEIPKPYGEPNIFMKYIALQLGSRLIFRITMKKAIELAKKTDIRGIKIQIAGHLNGAKIAHVEWAREGRVPLQTFQTKIGYCYYPTQTIYGVLGIKVWIFQDEK